MTAFLSNIFNWNTETKDELLDEPYDDIADLSEITTEAAQVLIESTSEIPVAPPLEEETISEIPVAPALEEETISEIPVAPPLEEETISEIPVAPALEKEFHITVPLFEPKFVISDDIGDTDDEEEKITANISSQEL